MIAIKDGKLLTVTNGVIEKGTVLIENGKITAVGEGLEIPAGAEVIDAAGKWVTPGLIDVHCHICLKQEPATMPTIPDILENFDPITPTMRSIDTFNPFDWAIGPVRRAGFTTCSTMPGSGNLIGGQSCAFKLRQGTTVFDYIIPGVTQMKMALGENPKRIHGGVGKPPRTRMGNASMLREALFKAKVYSDKLKAAESDPSKAPEPNFQLDPLVPVVRGEMKCRIHCHRADDIVTASRIAEEFGLRYTVEHVTEGWKILPYIKEHNMTCIVGPFDLGAYKQEVWDLRTDTPALMESAGIEDFCITHDTSSGTRFLPMFLGHFISRGLSFDMALRAVTINPAKVLELEDRIGSLEAGKDADLAIFSGNPFSSFTLCEKTIIDGKVYDNSEE